MSGGLKAAASAVRKKAAKTARHVSPTPERFKVLRVKPLLLDAYGSDLKLSEKDDDLEIGRGVRRHLSKGDDVMVITERDGDRVVVAVTGDDDDAEPAAALDKPDASAVSNEFGETEADVLRNTRTRLNQLENRLQKLGLLE